MDHIYMSLDYLAFLTAAVAVMMTVANMTLLVARLMHKDRFVKELQQLLANVVWVFRLGGGSAKYAEGRRRSNGGT